MRKTNIQLLLLILVGAIIFWREWSSHIAVGRSLQEGLERTIPPALTDFSPNSITWLVVATIGFLLLTEGLTRYFKMSSPNSV